MKRAGEEHRDNTTLEPTKERAKSDRAWQKLGQSSLNGYVSAVVDNKCVDVEALSKFCAAAILKWSRSCQGSTNTQIWLVLD